MYYQYQSLGARIVQVDWLSFRIPYRAAFTTAHGSEPARTGAILRVTTANRLVGMGEASPLAAFGGGTLADTLAIVADLAPLLLGQDVGQALALLDRLDYAAPGVAAAACGFDIAIHDLFAQAAGLPLAKLLDLHAAAAVPVNATIGAADAVAAAQAARRAVQAGIKCVKLKVGVARSFRAELARIGAVRAAIGPDVRLRLDANAAWDVPAAIAIIRAAAHNDLELVEQPVAVNDLVGMAQVRAAVGPLIAADESVAGPDGAQRVIAAAAADLLVIKPMVAGGIRRAREIIALAQAAGLQTFVTTTIDAGVGVAAALHLAATLPPPPLACGLATGPLLASDLLLLPIPIRNGAMQVPDQPGLGVRIDDNQLAQFAGSWQEMYV